MKKIVIIFFSFIMLAGCEKREQKLVKYIATDATSEYSISYRDASGELISKNITAQSKEDEWVYSFMSEKGNIVYVSGIYRDVNSSLKIMIMIDGKIYKQGESNGDTVNYLVVSGVVPY